MSNKTDTFYITHLIPDLLPKTGMRKLLFYTSNEKDFNAGIFYWGLDLTNPFDEAYMNNLVSMKKVIPFPQPIEVKKGQGLWLNPEGKIYTASIKTPNEGISPEPVYSPHELSKATQVYNQSIGSSKVPAMRVVTGI